MKKKTTIPSNEEISEQSPTIYVLKRAFTGGLIFFALE
jgi:hypothetical protein